MSTGLNALLALPSTSLLVQGSGTDGSVEMTSLGGLRDSKTTVYDFWTTRCTNCPAALDALDAIARQRPSVRFVGVNIDDAVAARGLVAQAASEGRWMSLTHVHLGEDEKEKAKDILGMKTVPFYVIVGEDGTVLRHGSARALPLKSVEYLDSVLATAASANGTSSGKEIKNNNNNEYHHAADENNASAANVIPIATTTTTTTTAADKGKAAATAPVECEGGVCKLVRKPKRTAPAKEDPPQGPAAAVVAGTAEPTAASAAPPSATAGTTTRGTECENGVCKLVRKPRKKLSENEEGGQVTAPAAAPVATADPTRKMDCEGGVCKLVRKPKKKASEKEGKEPVTAGVAAPAATPNATRTMECEGGVCKLVRKPKNAAGKDEVAQKESASSAEAVVEEKEEEEKSPLGVGDDMPSLQVVPLDGGSATTLDEVRAGRPAVLDFWTTRCVRCPAALDALEGLAAANAKEDGAAGAVTYVSLNLDSLEGARQMVSEGGGRWPTLSHAFAGGHDDQSETLLESFKARAGLKSVPFYVVLAADGRIEQIGGPKAVKLENKTAETSNNKGGAVAVVAPPSAPQPAPAPAAPKASSFTMDEDF